MPDSNVQEAFHREYIRPRRYPWFVPTILPDHAGHVRLSEYRVPVPIFTRVISGLP